MLITTPEAIPAFVPLAIPPPPALYANAADRVRHRENMEQLALETACAVSVIEPIYEQVLAKLQNTAKVKDYLPILVSKGVKKALKKVSKQQH